MSKKRVLDGFHILIVFLLLVLAFPPLASVSLAVGVEPASAADFPDFEHVVIDDDPPSTYRITDIQIGDISGDGLPDVWTAGRGDGSNADQMVWYKNPGWNRYEISPGDYVYGNLGDFDGDGDLDVVAGQHDDDRIYWFENTGDPESGDWPKSYLGVSPWADVVLVGDIDKDSRLDVVYLFKDEWGWAENPSNPKNTWSDHSIWSGGKRTGGALADIDRDSDLDLVYGNAWFENPLPGGDPTRGSQWDMHDIDSDWTTEARSAVGDLNGDGRPDVVLTGEEDESGVAWYIGPSDPRTGSWTKRSIVSSGYDGVHSVALADFDRDGDLDVFAAEMHHGDDPDKVTVFENVDVSSNTWEEHTFDTIGSHNAKAGDLDLDGWPDIVGKNYQAGTLPLQIDLWWNLGLGTLPVDQWERHIIDDARPWRAVFIDGGDVNGDSLPDIVAGGWWYENPGSPGGSWARHDIGGELYNMTVLHDLDRDGDLDILGTDGQPGGDIFQWAENDGSASFTIHTDIPRADGDFLQGARAAQIIPGGNPEVVLSWHDATHTQMYSIPHPATTDWSWDEISSTTNNEQIAVGDIDGDGDQDLHLGTQWLENDTGTWRTHDAFSLGDAAAQPDRVELADIDEDGDLDVVIGAEQSEWVVWGEAPSNPENAWTEHLIADDILGMSLDVADLDWDGDVDLVVGEHDPHNGDVGRVMIYQNMNGGASWNEFQIDSGLEHHVGTQFVDIDNDGDLDIVSIGWEHDKTVLYENKATSGGTGNRPPVAVDDAFAVDKGGILEIPAPGVLDNDWDGDNDPLTAWYVSGPDHGMLDLNPDGSLSYEHDGSAAEEDSFIYEVRDGQGGNDLATVSLWVQGPGSIDIRVTESTDDAEERVTDGDMALKGVDLELGEDSFPQLVGLRFQGVTLVPGVSIDRAHVVFSADETHSGDTDLTICAQAADDPPEFSSSDGDISGRSLTSACVDWNNVGAWTTVHDTYQTPDLAAVIQEIVNRSGWQAGNALVLVLSGSGRRTAEAYNGEPTMAPLLHVEYGGGAAPTCYDLTLDHSGTGGDPVASPDNSAGCPAGQYAAGEVVGLEASPGAGWSVASWSGTDDDGSTSSTNQVTMPAGAHSVTVHYEELAPTCYALSLGHTGTGGDPIASPGNSAGCGAGQYVAGEVVGLNASPAAGWSVASWSGTDDDGSTSSINQVTMPATGHTAMVHYEELPAGGSLDVRVSASKDDAEEKVDEGDMALKSVDLELGEDREPQLVGLRFQGVGLPPGASISGAHVTFSADETDSGDTDLTICAQAADDPPEFSSSDGDVSGRSTTSTCVAWNSVGAWTTEHDTYQSPDLAPVIQEIVDRPGWGVGNALLLIISGSGRRTAESYNGEPDMAPLLHVEYGGGAGPTCYDLTLDHTGTGGDPVALPGNSAGCPAGQYTAGEVVGLAASPGAGWSVASWTGTDNDGSTSATNQVTMPATGRTVTVHYEDITVTCYALSLENTGTGGAPIASPGNSAGCSAGQYVAGEAVGLSANPAAGWSIASWTGTDDDASTSTTNQVTMPATGHSVMVHYVELPPGGSLDVRVSQSTDDAEEKVSDGDIALKGADLELGEDRDPQLVGLRFQGVDLSPGTSITRAHVVFHADETYSGDTDLRICAQAADDPPEFSSSDGDISARSKTSTCVDWNNVGAWTTVHEPYQTPDLSPVIQEIVDRSGWQAGNALALIITGSGRRTAESYNGAPALAPLLHVEHGALGSCHVLTMDVDPPGAGSILADPGPNCGASEYAEGSPVEVMAQPGSGYTFAHWSGSLTGSTNPQTLAMDADRSITAHFAASDVGPVAYADIVIDDDDQDDSDGNGNGSADCGEVLELYVDLVNQGSVAATGVNATLSTEDPYVTWVYNPASSYPDLPGGGTGRNASDFDLVLGANTPSGHSIQFSLEATADNGGPWTDTFAIQVTCGGGSGSSLDLSVSDSSDDAEERLSSGTMIVKGSDLELVEDTSTQAVGLRFQDVSVPSGAIITDAYLVFHADEVHSGDTDLVFHGQVVDDAAAFSGEAGDISGRATTSASVAWNDVPAWSTVHDPYQSVDLSPIIQEIVSRPGWSAGNSLVIIITGDGRRVAESYDGAQELAPRLHIGY